MDESQEAKITRTWAKHLTDEALIEDLRRMAAQPRGWKQHQRAALLDEAANRLEAHAMPANRRSTRKRIG